MNTKSKINQETLEEVLNTVELLSGIKTIERINMWGFLKTYEPPEGGFMFNNNPTVNLIQTEICNDFPGHSCSSFGFTVRTLERIAKNEPELITYLRRKEYMLFIENLSGKNVLNTDVLKHIGSFV
jgi:hypothetical protein